MSRPVDSEMRLTMDRMFIWEKIKGELVGLSSMFAPGEEDPYHDFKKVMDKFIEEGDDIII